MAQHLPPHRLPSMKDEHYFAPHAVEGFRLRRRRLWARVIVLVGVAGSFFWLGYYWPR